MGRSYRLSLTIVYMFQSKIEESSCNKVSQNEKATNGQSKTPRKPKSAMGKQPSDIDSSVRCLKIYFSIV